MKNLNLSYILFGVFIIIIVTVMTCGKRHTEVHVMPEEVLSFPNPEEVKQEVKEKVNEVIEEVQEVKELIQEIAPVLEDSVVTPKIEVPAVIEPIEEIPIEETPVDSTKTSEINQEGVE